MYKGNRPRIVPIIIAIVVVALAIAALVSLGRLLFGGGNTQKSTVSVSDQIRTDTLDTASGRAVQFTERGSIVADEEFKSYQIVITPTTRTYTTYSGYLDRVVAAKTYQNNEQAYVQFVYALDKASISKIRSGSSSSDVRGVCATDGRLYTYETTNNSAATHMLWTSTCKGSPGDMGANVAQVKALFVNQIPDFDAKYLEPAKSSQNQ